ncbi:50S ribosomal protein L33 [Patescibacteria group bacterium]|nr:50S ribosomal protein L33 [Patescibacteria group bacterium]MBU4389918.1 50S ribosomal protein L33 [Patescibacteria group bacterium]MBU4396875.1 50S ribosomal protein L33 [Patescibacteria group bacterium]MBU4431374.1 50S ribosomal protein L33 [Patescibacteria group bacterium]MCG2701882.1 50S ribosomal protein L33 [Candidatus Parcubacteria bacterium]
MAKKKQNRFLVALLCTTCGAQNYLTERNKINTPDKLKLKKYCKWCRKRIEHKETSKLK